MKQYQELEVSDTELKYEKEFNHKETGRFKIQVYEGGKVEIQCLDSFYKVLGLSSEVLKSCKLIDLLAPTICKEHRIIVDSLFTCVFDLALLYVE